MYINSEVLKRLYGEGVHGEVQVSGNKVWYYANKNDTLQSYVDAERLVTTIKNTILSRPGSLIHLEISGTGSHRYRVSINNNREFHGATELEAFVSQASDLLERGEF